MKTRARLLSLSLAAAFAVPAGLLPAGAQPAPVTVTGVVQSVLPGKNIQIMDAKKELLTIYLDKKTKFVPHLPAVNDKISATGVPVGEGGCSPVTVVKILK